MAFCKVHYAAYIHIHTYIYIHSYHVLIYRQRAAGFDIVEHHMDMGLEKFGSQIRQSHPFSTSVRYK